MKETLKIINGMEKGLVGIKVDRYILVIGLMVKSTLKELFLNLQETNLWEFGKKEKEMEKGV